MVVIIIIDHNIHNIVKDHIDHKIQASSHRGGDNRSRRGSNASISMSTFVGVERKQAGDVQMSYVNDPQDGNYHVISKKDLKSPLIFNQIASGIHAGGRMKEKVIDNTLLAKFTAVPVPLPGRNYK